MNLLSNTLLAACALGIAAPAFADADTDTVRKAVAEKLPTAQIRSVAKAPFGGLYEVVVNGTQIFYTDEKGDVGFFGKLLELRTRADLTEKRAQELMTVDFGSLPLDKAIVKIRGDGSRKLAVFSDPDCPFCKQLEKELASVNNVTVYTFLYPLASLHPDAMRKAELIWCSADRSKAYEVWMLEGREPAAGAACDTPVRKVVALAEGLWIKGTPGMVFADGKLVPGAVPRHQIEAMLDAAARPQSAQR